MEKRIPNLAKKNKCTGCLACVDSCSHKALENYIGNDGHYYVKLDEGACVGCLKCERVCPVISKYNYTQSEESYFYAAWNLNFEERMASASGGAFSAMAHYVLETGGVVIGAVTESGFNVKHEAVENISDLYGLQGSKYAQSDTNGTYKKTRMFLSQGRTVLFSGTGCQIAGLLSFLRKESYKGNLITVDLICGGVPSKLLVKKFFEYEPYNAKRIVSYRTKDKGWKPKGFTYNMKVEDDEGLIHDYTGIPNLVTTGFSKELTERYSCYNCRFVGTHRQSDFTIGDLWGDSMYKDQHYMGLSLIIAHNKKAIALLKDMSNYLHITSCDKDSAVKVNFRLVLGKNARQYTLERFLMERLFSWCSYSILKKIYADDYSKMSLWELWGLARRAYVKILNKLI